MRGKLLVPESPAEKKRKRRLGAATKLLGVAIQYQDECTRTGGVEQVLDFKRGAFTRRRLQRETVGAQSQISWMEF